MQELLASLGPLVDAGGDDVALAHRIGTLVEARLPALMATAALLSPPGPGRYLVHRDAARGWVVMVFAWGPGETTPIHGHGTWSVEAVVRNALTVGSFDVTDPMAPVARGARRVGAGSVVVGAPPVTDVHQVANNTAALSVSLHVYGRPMDAVLVYAAGRRPERQALESVPWPG